MQKADLIHICASSDYFPKSVARPISNSSLKQLAWIFYLPSSLTGSCAHIYSSLQTESATELLSGRLLLDWCWNRYDCNRCSI